MKLAVADYKLEPHQTIGELSTLRYGLGPVDHTVAFAAAELVYDQKFEDIICADGILSRPRRTLLKRARVSALRSDPILRLLVRVNAASVALSRWNAAIVDLTDFTPYSSLTDATALGGMTVREVESTVATLTERVAADRTYLEPLMANSYKRVSIPYGDATTSAYEVECACGAVGHVTYRHASGLPEGSIERKMKQRGWMVRPGKAKCPTCLGETPVSKPVSKPTLVVAAEPPRQMSAADRRRVFRAVDEAWDENKGRYTGSTTDKSVAEELGVPRVWVETIRTEAFGPARNEDLDLLIGNLKNLKGEADRRAEKCLEMAAGYEEFSKQIAELSRKVAEHG